MPLQEVYEIVKLYFEWIRDTMLVFTIINIVLIIWITVLTIIIFKIRKRIKFT